MTGAAKLSGAAFTAAVKARLKPYLQQSRRPARDEQKGGIDPRTRALAAQTAAARYAALHQLPA